MKCPLCHNNGLKVIETCRHKDEGIRRRRECRKCHFRITTEERPINVPDSVGGQPPGRVGNLGKEG